MAKMTKNQKKNLMIIGGVALGYAFVRSNTSGLGFLTLPYSYEPSAPSYSQSYNTPSYTPSYTPSTYARPSFTSDNTSPFERQTVSAKMSDTAYFNMVRQISDTDGVMVIQNCTSFDKSCYVNPAADVRTLKIVRAQVKNAKESPRLTGQQVSHMQELEAMLSSRIGADSVAGYNAIGGVF